MTSTGLAQDTASTEEAAPIVVPTIPEPDTQESTDPTPEEASIENNEPTSETPTDAPNVEPTSETPTDTPNVEPTPVVVTPIVPTPEVTEIPEETSAPTEEVTETLIPTEPPTLVPPTATPDLPPEPALALFAAESFDDGDMSDWRLGAGWTLVESDGGQALETREPVAAAQFTLEQYADVVIEARFSSAGGTAQLLARQSSEGVYSASLSPDGRVELARSGVALAAAYTSPQDGGWHTLRLSVFGGALRVRVDDVEVLAYLDPSPLPAGYVSVAALFAGEADEANALRVDDVALWLPAGAVVEPTIEVTELPTLVPTATPVATSLPEVTPELVLDERDAKTGIPNLSTDLNLLFATHGRPSALNADERGQLAGLEVNGDRVKVMLIMLNDEAADAATSVIDSVGGEVTARYRRWLDAWVPIDSLDELAALPGTSLVRTPIRIFPIPDAEGQTRPEGTTPLQGSIPLQTVAPVPVSVDQTASNALNAPPEEITVLGRMELAGVSATIESVTRDRCVITVAFKVGAASSYRFQIWNAGTRIYNRVYSASANQRIRTQYTLDRAATSIGIYIKNSGGAVLASFDPYLIPLDTAQYCGNRTKSEGVAVSGANAWHTRGWMGNGVDVAILDSFSGYQTAQNNGNLPKSINTYGTIDTFSSRHGTAVAEVVFDMAPGATLTFASPATAVEMADSIIDLAQMGHEIISSSIVFYNFEPGDGTGPISEAIAEARTLYDTLYVQAAGNQGLSNWQGNFSDPDNDDFHNFTPNIEINILNNGDPVPAGWPILLMLRWNDWPVSDQDYDLYLWRWNDNTGQWQEVASSILPQNGFQPPTEEIYYITPSRGVYGFLISSYNTTQTHVLDLMGHNTPDFSPNRTARSLGDPATNILSFAVAALDVRSPYTLEDYSSRGPTMGPGGSLGVGNAQPRISGYANVTGWAYGTRGFNGTSAAQPHVAGAAALVWSAFPHYNASQVQAFLESRAVDLGAAGYDHTYGQGRLRMGGAPALGTPTLLAPANGSVQNTSTPILSWNAAVRAASYEIQISRNSAFTRLVFVAAGHSFTSVSPFLPDGTYYWRVRSETASGFAGAWSQTYVFTVDTP